MRKLLLGLFVVIGFASCQYVNNTVDVLKNNVKSSLAIPNILPSVNLKQNKEDKVANDSTGHFTLSNFIKQKFDL